MKIIYCSTVCSLETLKFLSEKFKYPYTSITIQKFHRLILEGFVQNGVSVDAVSISPCSLNLLNKLPKSKEGGILYRYVRTIEIPIIRHLLIILGTFFSILKIRLKTKEKCVVVCDGLNVSLCIGALLAKLLGFKIVTIITDMPGLMMGNNSGVISKFVQRINLFLFKLFDSFIFLTEAMNEVINKKNKPYIVMEGLVDIKMKGEKKQKKINKKKIIYAGGLYEKYGIKMLIEAFRLVSRDDIQLDIYGKGPMVNDMKKYEQLDLRLHYLGLKPNEEIVKAEEEAILLVNPRPSKERFTKYSFPSKNMEYMVSGTPVLTMALPGLPIEYYEKLFICRDETVEGLAEKLSEILSMTDEQLQCFGDKARQFVLERKNNVCQSKRILNLIDNI